jgi:hypothetical protein
MWARHRNFDWRREDAMMIKAEDLLGDGIGWIAFIFSKSEARSGAQHTVLYNADILTAGRQPLARLYVMSENPTAVQRNPAYRDSLTFQQMYAATQ